MPDSSPHPSRRRTSGVLVVAWVMIAAAVVAIGYLLTHALKHPVGDPENDLARWFRDRRTPTLTSVANAFTTPGNTPVALGLALLVVIGLVIWGRKWREALFVTLAIGGVYAIYVLGFTLDHRDRPPVKVLDPGLVPNHSFPSGHVAAATVLYGAIAVLLLAYAPAAARWVVPVLVLIPPLVMVSRLYLGAHHFSDTFTSLVFAGAWLFVLTRTLRPGEPTPA
jgi:undecaprenyl-diphosphatase